MAVSCQLSAEGRLRYHSRISEALRILSSLQCHHGNSGSSGKGCHFLQLGQPGTIFFNAWDVRRHSEEALR